MNRLILTVALSGSATFALATGEFLDAFLTYYKVKPGTPLSEKSCGICHVSDSDFSFNPFGKDVKKALTDKKASAVDGAILASVENLDSDGDGKPNGAEIAAGTFPGDPGSGGAQGSASAATAPVEEAPKPRSNVPKNGYHPAIVHFPIALFISGLILDFLGMVRKDKAQLQAGWYSIVMAAVASVGAIVSGVVAMSMLKLPYRGLILNHLALAILSATLMWNMVALRVDRHEKMNIRMRVIYYVLAFTCLAAISWAGHLGGEFVYGE